MFCIVLCCLLCSLSRDCVNGADAEVKHNCICKCIVLSFGRKCICSFFGCDTASTVANDSVLRINVSRSQSPEFADVAAGCESPPTRELSSPANVEQEEIDDLANVKYFEIDLPLIANHSAAINAFLMTSKAFLILQKLDLIGHYLPLRDFVSPRRFQAIINHFVRFSDGAVGSQSLSSVERADIVLDFPHVRSSVVNLFRTDDDAERRETNSRLEL